MREYSLKSEEFSGEIIFRYNDEEILVGYENNANLSIPQTIYLFKIFPFELLQLEKFTSDKSSKSTMLEITKTFTFEEFWDKYDYKIGNKKRAEKLFNQLRKAERASLMAFIPKFQRWKLVRNQEMMYPETFLNQRQWECILPGKQ